MTGSSPSLDRRILATGGLAALLFAGGCSVVGLPGDNIRGCVAGPAPAPQAAEPGTRLLALGDFGDGTTGRNVDVAEALEAFLVARDLRPEATVLLGDNFYPSGLIGARTACSRLRSSASDRAIAAQLSAVLEPFGFLRERSVTWAIPGNHDHRCPHLGSLANQARIDRWLPPANAWNDRWQSIPGLPREILRDERLQVIAIDSTRMIEDPAFLDESVRLLEDLLDEGSPAWRIVAAHHPLYANGHHDGAWFSGAFAKTLYYPTHLLLFPPLLYGNHANYEWAYRRYRRRLEDVFSRRPADVFLAGHEHALELLEPAGPGQPYNVISGSASRCAKIMRRANTIFGAARNGFAILEAGDDVLEIEFVGTRSCTSRSACGRPVRPGEWHSLGRHSLHRPDAGELTSRSDAP